MAQVSGNTSVESVSRMLIVQNHPRSSVASEDLAQSAPLTDREERYQARMTRSGQALHAGRTDLLHCALGSDILQKQEAPVTVVASATVDGTSHSVTTTPEVLDAAGALLGIKWGKDEGKQVFDVGMEYWIAQKRGWKRG